MRFFEVSHEGAKVTHPRLLDLVARRNLASSFAMTAEVLSTPLAGALPTMLDPASGSQNQFAAYDIKAFTDVDRFKRTMDDMLRETSR